MICVICVMSGLIKKPFNKYVNLLNAMKDRLLKQY